MALDKIRFFQVDGIGENAKSSRISRGTAEELFSGIFPGHTIEGISGYREVNNVHFEGRVKIYPNQAVILEGQLKKDNRPVYEVRVILIAKESTMYLERMYEIGEGRIGAGPAALHHMQGLAAELGLQNVMVDPARDGGWLWARLGAIPIDSCACEELQLKLRQKLEDYRGKDQIEPVLYQKALALINGLPDAPDNLKALAAITDKVGSFLGGRRQSLGRALLCDTMWLGVMPSNDMSASTVQLGTIPSMREISDMIRETIESKQQR